MFLSNAPVGARLSSIHGKPIASLWLTGCSRKHDVPLCRLLLLQGFCSVHLIGRLFYNYSSLSDRPFLKLVLNEKSSRKKRQFYVRCCNWRCQQVLMRSHRVHLTCWFWICLVYLVQTGLWVEQMMVLEWDLILWCHPLEHAVLALAVNWSISYWFLWSRSSSSVLFLYPVEQDCHHLS